MKQENCVKKKFKIAITGNIGSGKTTISNIITKLGFKVFQSDKEVSKIYLKKNVKTNIASVFLKKIKNLFDEKGQIDRNVLGSYVFKDKKELKKLEKIIYPELYKIKKVFINNNIKERILFFDVPLLFEKKLHYSYDKIIYLYTDEFTQKKRVLRRKNMNEEKLKTILKNQLSRISSFDNFISLKINTNCSREKLKEKIETFTNNL